MQKAFHRIASLLSLSELCVRNNLNKQLALMSSLTVNVLVVFVPVIYEITAKWSYKFNDST